MDQAQGSERHIPCSRNVHSRECAYNGKKYSKLEHQQGVGGRGGGKWTQREGVKQEPNQIGKVETAWSQIPASLCKA